MGNISYALRSSPSELVLHPLSATAILAVNVSNLFCQRANCVQDHESRDLSVPLVSPAVESSVGSSGGVILLSASSAQRSRSERAV